VTLVRYPGVLYIKDIADLRQQLLEAADTIEAFGRKLAEQGQQLIEAKAEVARLKEKHATHDLVQDHPRQSPAKPVARPSHRKRKRHGRR
jgi:hypothetical protein